MASLGNVVLSTVSPSTNISSYLLSLNAEGELDSMQFAHEKMGEVMSSKRKMRGFY